LLPDSEKDAKDNSTWEINGLIKYCEFINDGGDLKTKLKGEDVRTVDNSLERRSLEMRINIQR